MISIQNLKFKGIFSHVYRSKISIYLEEISHYFYFTLEKNLIYTIKY